MNSLNFMMRIIRLRQKSGGVAFFLKLKIVIKLSQNSSKNYKLQLQRKKSVGWRLGVTHYSAIHNQIWFQSRNRFEP